MERVRWINHNGKQVLLLDLSRLFGEEYVATIRRYEKMVEESHQTDMLSLTDVTNAKVFGEPLTETKRIAKKVRSRLKKRAVIGLSTPKKVLAQAVNLFAGGTPTKPFDTRAEALEYLTK